jgi:hypothetical protein
MKIKEQVHFSKAKLYDWICYQLLCCSGLLMRWLSLLLACQHLDSGTNLKCESERWFGVQADSLIKYRHTGFGLITEFIERIQFIIANNAFTNLQTSQITIAHVRYNSVTDFSGCCSVMDPFDGDSTASIPMSLSTGDCLTSTLWNIYSWWKIAAAPRQHNHSFFRVPRKSLALLRYSRCHLRFTDVSSMTSNLWMNSRWYWRRSPKLSVGSAPESSLKLIWRGGG